MKYFKHHLMLTYMYILIVVAYMFWHKNSQNHSLVLKKADEISSDKQVAWDHNVMFPKIHRLYK